MATVAVILAQGFEEIEALTVVDVLRRANISCDMVGFEEQVTGSHDIQVKADRIFDGDLSDYDLVCQAQLTYGIIQPSFHRLKPLTKLERKLLPSVQPQSLFIKQVS